MLCLNPLFRDCIHFLNGSDTLFILKAKIFTAAYKLRSLFSGCLLETLKVWHGRWKGDIKSARNQPQASCDWAQKHREHFWKFGMIFLSCGGALWWQKHSELHKRYNSFYLGKKLEGDVALNWSTAHSSKIITIHHHHFKYAGSGE